MAVPVQFLVVGAAEWHGELVADLAPQRARLRDLQVVRIAGRHLTDEAWLGGDEGEVLLSP